MGTTADKLQRLVEGKQAIVDAVNSKLNTSLTINSKLSNIASVIGNISSSGGVNISDATANENDILKGKTAYTFEGKVEGTIETYNGENENGVILDDMLQKKIDSSGAYGLFAYWQETNLNEYINYLDLSNVTNMSYMFAYCEKITSIPQLDTSKVTNMYYMFYYCSSLTTIPQLDTSKVTDMSNMFYYCSKITSIPQLDTSKVTNMFAMFYNCAKLTTIDITYYNISPTQNVTFFARQCNALKSLIIRSFGTSYTLNSNSLTSSGISSGTGYIYVPRSMVDTLKSATNWSTYASQIRALEDYTIDGTTSGALDESKI